MFNKVFCIGFNKTGTSSMHQLFLELGLASYHGYYSHFPLHDPIFGQFQCFSDGDQHDFAGLDRAYPGSRFIVTTRRLDDWLVSRVRHVEARRRIGATGPMRQEYEADPPAAVRRWIRQRLAYHASVVAHFAGRDDALLVVDICRPADPAATRGAITAFLGLPVEPGRGLPHENARDADPPAAPGAPPVRSRAEVLAEVQAALAAEALPPAQWGSVFP